MNACHMSVGLKNVCRTWALPGASRKTTTIAASTTSVLAEETAVARRPPPDSRRGPRPVVPNDPGAGPPTPRLMAGCRATQSWLDRRDGAVDLQVPLLQRLQRPVRLQRRDGLVHARDQRVAQAEQQAVVLACARALGDHLRAGDLRGGDVLGGWRVRDERGDLVRLQRRLHVVQRLEHLWVRRGLDLAGDERQA